MRAGRICAGCGRRSHGYIDQTPYCRRCSAEGVHTAPPEWPIIDDTLVGDATGSRGLRPAALEQQRPGRLSGITSSLLMLMMAVGGLLAIAAYLAACAAFEAAVTPPAPEQGPPPDVYDFEDDAPLQPDDIDTCSDAYFEPNVGMVCP